MLSVAKISFPVTLDIKLLLPEKVKNKLWLNSLKWWENPWNNNTQTRKHMFRIIFYAYAYFKKQQAKMFNLFIWTKSKINNVNKWGFYNSIVDALNICLFKCLVLKHIMQHWWLRDEQIKMMIIFWYSWFLEKAKKLLQSSYSHDNLIRISADFRS